MNTDSLPPTDTKALEITVGKARGWTVEPYVAIRETSRFGKEPIIHEFDRFRLKDEKGVVRSDWGFDEAETWRNVPHWATMSAHRDELEAHICERFGSVTVTLLGDDSALCFIYGSVSQVVSLLAESEGESKGVAVCRAYLIAVAGENGRSDVENP